MSILSSIMGKTYKQLEKDYMEAQSERMELKQRQSMLYNPDGFTQKVSKSNPLMMQKYKQEQSDITYRNVKPPTMVMTTRTSNGGRIPMNPFPIPNLYQLVRNVDAARIPIDVLIKEMHRNGFHIEPRFRLRCQQCGKEFQDMPLEETDEPECDVCGNKGEKNFDKPDWKERKIVSKLLKGKKNDNEQSFVQISKQVMRDRAIADDAYVILMYEYHIKDNKVVGKKLQAIEVASPMITYIIADSFGRRGYDDNGKKIWVCPRDQHRKSVVYAKDGNVPVCPMCKCECIPAYAEIMTAYAGWTSTNSSIVYARGEVLHVPAASWETGLYGYSRFYTVMSKAITLFHMDEYFRKYFDKMRPPKGALFVSTSNKASLNKTFNEMRDQAKRDPYDIYPIMVENERGNRNFVQYVNFTGSLQELQLDKVRDEFRRTMGAMFGILPLFAGEIQEGSWSQEGLQTMVVNRAVTADQEGAQDTFYDPLLKILGVNDWVLKLQQAEDTDLLREEQIAYQKNMNAQSMQAMGFGVELDADGNFVYTDKPIGQDQQMQQMDGDMDTEKKPPMADAGTQMTGEARLARPSDPGGSGQGFPAAGNNTSMAMKSHIDVDGAVHKKSFKVRKSGR